MLPNPMTYQTYADRYQIPKLEKARKNVMLRGGVVSKLAYLMKQMEILDEQLFATGDALKTHIKTNVYSAFRRGTVEEYMAGASYEDYKKLCDEWEARYQGGVTADLAQISVEKYSDLNKDVLPHEIITAFQESGKTEIHSVPHECIAGICLGMILLKESLEAEVHQIIEKSSLSLEVMDMIAEKYGKKIIWTKSIVPLANLMRALAYADCIKLKDEGGHVHELPSITFLHFQVSGRAKNSVASISSFRMPFQNANHVAKSIYKTLIGLLQ